MSECEFGRFYYVIEAKKVVCCVSHESRTDGRYWFAMDPAGCGAATYLPSDVALIPHMRSWDYDGPKHPGDGWRFLGEGERPQEGDEFFDRSWRRSAVPRIQDMFPYRRRIEPDHVAAMDTHMECVPGDIFGTARNHWQSIKAELLELRKLNESRRTGQAEPGGTDAEEPKDSGRIGHDATSDKEGIR